MKWIPEPNNKLNAMQAWVLTASVSETEIKRIEYTPTKIECFKKKPGSSTNLMP